MRLLLKTSISFYFKNYTRLCKLTLPLVLFFVTNFSIAQVNLTVRSGDSNTVASNLFATALNDGGTITFEEGTWTITLTSAQAQMRADLVVQGANTRGSMPTQGAYTGSNIKSTITIVSPQIKVRSGCDNLTIKDIKWTRVGMRTDAFHQPIFNFDNVIFDLSDFPAGGKNFERRTLHAPDGIGGSITNVSFLGFSLRAIAFNRTINLTERPFEQLPAKLVIDRCLFETINADKESDALGFDAGNDEYSVIWDFLGTEVKRSKFVDCRFALSKIKNMSLVDNTFIQENTPKEAMHFEEFSKNILVKGNVVEMIGPKKKRAAITLGAEQTSSDVVIDGNRVIQTDQLERFITANNVTNITIKDNTIENPVDGEEYVNFWGRCGNIGTIFEGTNSGLENRIRIDDAPCDVILNDGTFYIKWGANRYLRGFNNGNVRLTNLATQPNQDEYKWRLVLKQNGSRNNYHTIQNVLTGNFLEVLKGPNGSEQRNFLNRKQTNPSLEEIYNFFGQDVFLSAKDNYTGKRAPGFTIFEESGNYSILPGSNERRSEIRPTNNSDNILYVFIVESNNNALNYNWQITPAESLNINDGYNLKSVKPYPNPVQDILYIPTEESISWEILNLQGQVLKTGTSKSINVMSLLNGLYFFKTANGSTFKFLKQ